MRNKFLTRININIDYIGIKKIFQNFFISKSCEVEFFEKFTNYINKKNIILTGSGRAALYLILCQIKKKTKKKKILISPYTLTEVINVIEHAGFEPSFVDLNIDSGIPNFSSQDLDDDICAILITHLFTSVGDLRSFINEYKDKVFLIEDAALNLGAKDEIGNYFGTLTDYGFFSFGAAKNLCLINGGAAYIKSDENFEIAKNIHKEYLKYPKINFIIQFVLVILVKIFSSKIILKIFSFRFIKSMYKNKSFLFYKLYPGLNPKFRKYIPDHYRYKISDYCYEAGIYQIERDKKNILIRKNKAKYYSNKLKTIKNENIKIFYLENFNENSFIEYPIYLKKNTVDEIHNEFLKHNIDLRIKWYMNNAKFKKFNSNPKMFKNSELCEYKILCLPLHDLITFEDIDFIVEKLKKILEK